MEGGGTGGGVSLATTYRPGYVSVPDSMVRMAAEASHREAGTRSTGQHHQPIKFPPTRAILWDHRNTGPSVFLHPAQYRNPALILEEKTLRLAHRFAEDTADATYTCALTGSVTTDSDGEGLSVIVDRFDPQRGQECSHMPDELLVPCQVEKNSSKPHSSVQDYVNAIEQVGQQCSSKSRVDMSRFLAVHAYCSYHGNRDNFIFHMDFDLVMPKTKLKVTPINPVPVMATALSKNLSGPLSMSEVQGEAKSGYLSMDQTRKLLLVLESDPKVSRLPLVGLWLSGVSSVQDPFVWANCLRYLYNSSLQERVCSGSEPFLVVLYSATHSQPQFFECVPSDGRVKLDMELRTCHEVIQLPKLCLERAQSPLELELTTVESGHKLDMLQAALHNCAPWLENIGKKQDTGSQMSGSLDDMMPRTSPAPHREKAAVIKPSVPEVSLLWDENVHSTTTSESPHSRKSSHRPRQPLKPVNRGSSSSVPASPTVTGPAKHTPHSLPNSPNVPQGQCGNQPAMRGPHMGGPPQMGGPRMGGHPMGMGGPGPMMPGQMYPAHMVQPYRQDGWQQYPPYVYNGQYPQQPQVYPQQQYNPSMPNQYGYTNSGPPGPVYPPQPAGYNNARLGPVPRPAQRMAPPGGAPPRHGSHLGVQDSAPAPPPPQMSPADYAGSDRCRCCPGGVHSKANRTEPPVSTSSATQAAENAAPVSQWPSPIMADRDKQPVSQSGSPEAVQVHSTSLGDSPVANNTEHDSGLQTTQSTQSRTMDGTQMSPDVYALLRMQDEQLKMLRQQLSQLMAKQSADDASRDAQQVAAAANKQESATQSSDATTSTKHSMVENLKETCSVAINTSLWWPNTAAEDGNTSVQSQHACMGAHPQLGLPPQRMCSEEEGGVAFSNETLSLGEFQLSHRLDRTEESMMSEMLVDMPAYTSMSPDKSAQHSSSGYGDTDDSNQSPVLGESVSMYQQEEITVPSQPSSGDDTGLGESQPDASLLFKDQKRFYQNLMGNVEKLLGQSGESVESPPPRSEASLPHQHTARESQVPASLPRPVPEMLARAQQARPPPDAPDTEAVASPPPRPDVADHTRQQLLKMGINVDALNADKSYRLDQTFYFDSAMLPKINYVSMMLDRDSDTSADADALSMKYLSDEQLSELAKIRLHSPHKVPHHAGLDRVVGSMQRSTPEVTTYGLPPTNMSFATKKYMERYGLTKERQDQDTTYNTTLPESEADTTEPGVINVRDFLKKLADRSLELTRQSEQLDDTLQASPRVAGNCVSRDASMVGVPLNYYSDGESFHIQGKPSSTPADRRPSIISDTTPNRTPQKTPMRRPQAHRRKYAAPASEGTPVRVFADRGRHNDSDPLPAQADVDNQQKFAAYLAVGGGNAPQNTPPRRQQKAGMVLDIERLKELPKLL